MEPSFGMNLLSMLEKDHPKKDSPISHLQDSGVSAWWLFTKKLKLVLLMNLTLSPAET